MFPTDITLAGTSTSKTYSLISIEARKSLRSNPSAALDAPQLLTVSHQEVTRTGYVADRHLIKLDLSVAGVSPAPNVKGTVALTIEAPRVTMTTAQIKDIKDQLVAFIATAGYVDKVLNGEP